MWNSPINWSNKRQIFIATLTTKAKYLSKCNIVKELVFLADCLKEIRYKKSIVIILLIFANNQIAIKLAINLVNYPGVKHIDIQNPNMHELILDVVIELDYIEISKIVADGLTKLSTLVKH